MISLTKEKREFLVQVSVKRKKTGSLYNLKRYVEIELEWQGNKGVLAEQEKIISFMNEDGVSEEGGYFSYNFRLTKLEVERNWKKDFFKDHVKSWELEPIQDNESIKIITYWGTRVDPTQYRARGFLIVGTAFLLLVGGILAWFLWKKKN